ncbi:hypothetical protein T03_6872 [Trichinella britovi]|uniref:Uncharacterized protein n=1 Tax=Trichinella britovi TaxID=45882 RepID=A0A0V0ZC15_TRIBR|nr:hypothetical protein T03_6872 [Trichinella britovi]
MSWKNYQKRQYHGKIIKKAEKGTYGIYGKIRGLLITQQQQHKICSHLKCCITV